MAETLTIAVQRQLDQDARDRQDYGSEGYVTVPTTELQLQDQISLAASETRTLFNETGSANWKLLYVEARGSQLTLRLTTLDLFDANPQAIDFVLRPGLPFMLGSKFMDIAGTDRYVQQVAVVEELSLSTAKVAYTIVR
ncbi:MAG: hypothetical protein JSV86_05640 [Gemmatimonadota bacterium]|nr:MAG: hypothetical protein JSV86_05640 [Gemmatimonadota bacterium]